MPSCFPCCGRDTRTVLEPTPMSNSMASHKRSPSSKERNYFNKMNKDPCCLIEEVKAHLNVESFADTKYIDFSSPAKEKSIDAMTIHGPLAKLEGKFAHPCSNALIQQLDGYKEDKEELLVCTIVSKNGISYNAEERQDECIITEDTSFMSSPVKEIFCFDEDEDEKKKFYVRSSLKDSFILEDKELDCNEADKEKLSGKLISDPSLLAKSENKPAQAIFGSVTDERETLETDFQPEGVACVLHDIACDSVTHQNPVSNHDEINMCDEASGTQDRERKQGAVNAKHAARSKYYDKGVITSQSKLEPKALFSYGISDQQRDFLFLCAGLVVQAVGFQLRSLVEVATALILLCYRIYIFACHFADTLSHTKQKLAETRALVFSSVAMDRTSIALQKERWESMKPLLIQWAKKMGWGCLNVAYVLAMLGALLLTSFLFSYLAVKGGAKQKPVHIMKELYFDYTMAHPAASLDLSSLDAYSRMSNATKGIKGNPGAGIRYRCTILLTLPESDHNRKLGVFQVRAELLSEQGETIVKGSQPCMLEFKSSTLHNVKTMAMVVPLLAGLAAEAQTLRLQLLEWHHDEGAGARVLQIALVPRAGVATGTGLPHLYKAHLQLDSLHTYPARFPSSSSYSILRTLFMWLLLSFLMFACLSTFCMYKLRSKS